MDLCRVYLACLFSLISILPKDTDANVRRKAVQTSKTAKAHRLILVAFKPYFVIVPRCWFYYAGLALISR